MHYIGRRRHHPGDHWYNLRPDELDRFLPRIRFVQHLVKVEEEEEKEKVIEDLLDPFRQANIPAARCGDISIAANKADRKGWNGLFFTGGFFLFFGA
jgi:hypothetical protein